MILIDSFGCMRNMAELMLILFIKELKEKHPKKLRNMPQFFGRGKKKSRYVLPLNGTFVQILTFLEDSTTFVLLVTVFLN